MTANKFGLTVMCKVYSQWAKSPKKQSVGMYFF